ncbi:putative zinc-type alcohol dehydrogenase-like protein [Coleophoma crateriformis]|uniref:Putative zinc-type alcohol dehydrogenase-like protein n=1 Tax=Coleophoma crateriformis TaxID=565419 RepID=A0A3D8Q550_9HELO|nr:putative zinc-type alcohol dehydrogenase-like protein [Coleophoma crateriformis]
MATMKIPSTMRSWQYRSTKGGLESNLTLSIVPVPQPTADQHVVRIIAAAVNPVDYRLAEFQLLHRLTFPKPVSPGNDFAGYIVKPAPGSALKPGQLVFGGAGTNFMCGGSRVLLNGGSGGVGAFGIQIAKAEGRHVTVTCSTANVKLCKSLGADEVIDYKVQNVLQTLKASPQKYDLVVDNVGNDQNLYWKAHEYMNPGAKFVTVAVSHQFSFIRFAATAQLLPSLLSGATRQHLIVFGNGNAEDLRKIADWIVEGKIKAVIDSKYNLEELRQAYQRLKTGRARGKIIVNVGQWRSVPLERMASAMNPIEHPHGLAGFTAVDRPATYSMLLSGITLRDPLALSYFGNLRRVLSSTMINK